MTAETRSSSGIVLVRRLDWARLRGAELRSRQPPAGFDADDAQRAYRGLDGELWPPVSGNDTIERTDGFAKSADADKVLELRNRLTARNRANLDVIHCVTIERGENPDRRPPPGFTVIGFDFGEIAGEDNHYSVLLHEVIFGAYDELRQFVTQLNSHLLFESLAPMADLAETRARLSAGGADLETIDAPGPVPIQIAIPSIDV